MTRTATRSAHEPPQHARAWRPVGAGDLPRGGLRALDADRELPRALNLCLRICGAHDRGAVVGAVDHERAHLNCTARIECDGTVLKRGIGSSDRYPLTSYYPLYPPVSLPGPAPGFVCVRCFSGRGLIRWRTIGVFPPRTIACEKTRFRCSSHQELPATVGSPQKNSTCSQRSPSGQRQLFVRRSQSRTSFAFSSTIVTLFLRGELKEREKRSWAVDRVADPVRTETEPDKTENAVGDARPSPQWRDLGLKGREMPDVGITPLAVFVC